ncbi:MAG: hypothetical protein ABJN69_05260 [Hellea sp.]
MTKLFALIFVLVLASWPQYSAAQDEIVVTATRRISSNASLGTSSKNFGPGIFIEKRGDFLLLEVKIENDSREYSTRLKEIGQTVDKFIAAAKDNPAIELSIVDDSSFVRPLTRDNFSDNIGFGSRPDTSVAILKVKTQIPERVEDSYKIAQMLSEFVDAIEEEDRTTINSYDKISVSVVNPYQYRKDVIKKVVEEINVITEGLGPDYRVVLTGLDKELTWTRSGDLKLAFFLPYSYDIIPNTLHSYPRD